MAAVPPSPGVDKTTARLEATIQKVEEVKQALARDDIPEQRRKVFTDALGKMVDVLERIPVNVPRQQFKKYQVIIEVYETLSKTAEKDQALTKLKELAQQQRKEAHDKCEEAADSVEARERKCLLEKAAENRDLVDKIYQYLHMEEEAGGSLKEAASDFRKVGCAVRSLASANEDRYIANPLWNEAEGLFRRSSDYSKKTNDEIAEKDSTCDAEWCAACVETNKDRRKTLMLNCIEKKKQVRDLYGDKNAEQKRLKEEEIAAMSKKVDDIKPAPVAPQPTEEKNTALMHKNAKKEYENAKNDGNGEKIFEALMKLIAVDKERLKECEKEQDNEKRQLGILKVLLEEMKEGLDYEKRLGKDTKELNEEARNVTQKSRLLCEALMQKAQEKVDEVGKEKQKRGFFRNLLDKLLHLRGEKEDVKQLQEWISKAAEWAEEEANFIIAEQKACWKRAGDLYFRAMNVARRRADQDYASWETVLTLQGKVNKNYQKAGELRVIDVIAELKKESKTLWDDADASTGDDRKAKWSLAVDALERYSRAVEARNKLESTEEGEVEALDIRANVSWARGEKSSVTFMKQRLFENAAGGKKEVAKRRKGDDVRADLAHAESSDLFMKAAEAAEKQARSQDVKGGNKGQYNSPQWRKVASLIEYSIEEGSSRDRQRQKLYKIAKMSWAKAMGGGREGSDLDRWKEACRAYVEYADNAGDSCEGQESLELAAEAAGKAYVLAVKSGDEGAAKALVERQVELLEKAAEVASRRSRSANAETERQLMHQATELYKKIGEVHKGSGKVIEGLSRLADAFWKQAKSCVEKKEQRSLWEKVKVAYKDLQDAYASQPCNEETKAYGLECQVFIEWADAELTPIGGNAREKAWKKVEECARSAKDAWMSIGNHSEARRCNEMELEASQRFATFRCESAKRRAKLGSVNVADQIAGFEAAAFKARKAGEGWMALEGHEEEVWESCMTEIDALLHAAALETPKEAAEKCRQAGNACKKSAPKAGVHKKALERRARLFDAMAAGKEGDKEAVAVIKKEIKDDFLSDNELWEQLDCINAIMGKELEEQLKEDAVKAAQKASEEARKKADEDITVAGRGTALEKQDKANELSGADLNTRSETKKEVVMNQLARAVSEQSNELFVVLAKNFRELAKLYGEMGKTSDQRKFDALADAMDSAGKEGLSSEERARIFNESREICSLLTELKQEAGETWNRAVQGGAEAVRLYRRAIYLYNCVTVISDEMGGSHVAIARECAGWSKSGEASICSDKAGGQALRKKSSEEFVAAGNAFLKENEKEDAYKCFGLGMWTKALSLDDDDPQKLVVWAEAADYYIKARDAIDPSCISYGYYGRNGFRCRAWSSEELEAKFEHFKESAKYAVDYANKKSDTTGVKHFEAGKILREAACTADELADNIAEKLAKNPDQSEEEKQRVNELRIEAQELYEKAQSNFLEAARLRGQDKSNDADICSRLAEAIQNKLSASNQ